MSTFAFRRVVLLSLCCVMLLTVQAMAQTLGLGGMLLSGWQIKPATDPAKLPTDEDWATLPVNAENPHNNSAYDWRYISVNKSGTTWAKVKHGDVNSLWWRLPFELDASYKGQRVFVDFAQNQGDAIVFCNGKRVSELLRPGGMVELTDFVQVGKPNMLLVFNTRDYTGISRDFKHDVLRYLSRHMVREIPMNQWAMGITGPVTLLKVNTPVGITDQYARCDWAGKSIAIDVQTDAVQKLDNAVMHTVIRDADGKVALQFDSKPMNIAAGQHTQTITSNWSNPIGWQIDAPYLYTMQVTLKQDGKTIDTAPARAFGFRDLKVVGREIHINGVKTRLRTSSFISGKTTGDIAFLNLMGYNFFYIQPNPTGWWQNWSETRSYTDNFFDYTDKHGLGLSLPIPGVDHLRTKLLNDDAVRKAYVAEQQAFVRRYRGHPSVLFWTVGMNTMNPQDAIHPTTMGQREKYSHPMAYVIAFASDTAKAVDPNTLVYSHADGNQGDMATANLYTNFAPLQEREDWPMYWAQKGDMPYCAVEFGQPITANFIKGKQVYLPEFMARVLGDRVYANETDEALSKINDVINSPWVTDRYLPLYQDTYWNFHRLFMEHTNRAWRTYDVTALGYYWDFSISFGDPPGFDPKREKVFGKYAKYIKAPPTKVPDWVNKNFYIHRDGQQPLMTYLAGYPTHTDKTHAFYAGDKITKQLAFVWDGPADTKLTAQWMVMEQKAGLISKGSQEVTLKAGDIKLYPFSFTAPDVKQRTPISIMLVVKDGQKEIATDSILVEVFPAQSSEKINRSIALFDPASKSSQWVKALGSNVKDWQPGDSLSGVKLLVIGREALHDLKALPYTDSDVRNGLNVLMLQQSPTDWEKMGFKCIEVGTRVLEPRLVSDPIVEGLNMTDLSYWADSTDLLPANKPARSYDTRHAPRVDNKHVVAPVMFEIPQRVGFTPLMAGEFDMNYSPLLRYRDGKGQILFCSLSLTDRVGKDPVPTRIAAALLADSDEPATRTTHLAGQNKALAALGFASQDAKDKGLLIVDGKTTTVTVQEFRSYAAGGGNVIVFQAPDALLASMGYKTQKLTLRKAALAEPLKAMGIGQNLLRWREAIQTTGFAAKGQPTDCTVLASGLILQQSVDSGRILFAQFSPDMLNGDEPYHTQLASQRLRQLASQLITAIGASPSFEQSKRLNAVQTGARFNWLKYWHVLGPIKAQGKGAAALDPEYPGQKAAITGDTNPNFFYQQEDGANLDFRKTVMAKENGFVDIASVVNQADGYVAYATRNVESDEARAAIFKMGVDYWADVYLNGKHVFRAINRKGSPRANGMSVKLNLKKGNNVITLKVVSGSRGFGFWASLSEGDINELQQQQQDQSSGIRLYTPLPQPFDPYEYHYW